MSAEKNVQSKDTVQVNAAPSGEASDQSQAEVQEAAPRETAPEAPKEKKPKKGKKIVKKIILLLLLVIVLAGVGFFAYSKLKSDYTITYDTYTASIGSISNSLSFSGNMQLVDNEIFYPSSSATVRSIYVSEGDTVEKGTRLMRLSNGDNLEANFSGRVNKIYVEEDDEVSGNTSLLQVADFNNMKVSVRVDEYDIASVQVGSACRVTVTANEKTFDSVISSIDYISSSGGNVAYYTAVLYVTLDGTEGVLPGMQVTVTIPQEEAENVVVLKADALSFNTDNSAYVNMMNESGQMEKVTVEVGVSNGNYVEIKSGLENGDTVYVEVKQETTSGGLFSSLFGSMQVNGGGGNMPGGDMGGDFSGGMPSDFSGGGNMPGGSGGGGNRSSGNGGGGNRP